MAQRKSTITTEESAPGSPLRRSSRIATTAPSPAPLSVTRRRSSASIEQPSTPAKIGKTKRLSLSQEPAQERPATPKRGLKSRAGSKSPTLQITEKEAPGTPSRRGRRSSITKVIEEEIEVERAASPKTLATRRRSLRGQSSSPTNTAPEPAKPRARRGSVTDKITPLAAIDETSKEEEKKKPQRATRANKIDTIEETEDEEVRVLSEATKVLTVKLTPADLEIVKKHRLSEGDNTDGKVGENERGRPKSRTPTHDRSSKSPEENVHKAKRKSRGSSNSPFAEVSDAKIGSPARRSSRLSKSPSHSMDDTEIATTKESSASPKKNEEPSQMDGQKESSTSPKKTSETESATTLNATSASPKKDQVISSSVGQTTSTVAEEPSTSLKTDIVDEESAVSKESTASPKKGHVPEHNLKDATASPQTNNVETPFAQRKSPRLSKSPRGEKLTSPSIEKTRKSLVMDDVAPTKSESPVNIYDFEDEIEIYKENPKDKSKEEEAEELLLATDDELKSEHQAQKKAVPEEILLQSDEDDERSKCKREATSKIAETITHNIDSKEKNEKAEADSSTAKHSDQKNFKSPATKKAVRDPLLKNELDMSYGSDGSFHLNLSIAKSNSQDSLGEVILNNKAEEKLNTSTGSDGSDKENRQASPIKVATRKSLEVKNVFSSRTETLVFTSHTGNTSTPRISLGKEKFYEPMEVDDADSSMAADEDIVVSKGSPVVFSCKEPFKKNEEAAFQQKSIATNEDEELEFEESLVDDTIEEQTPNVSEEKLTGVSKKLNDSRKHEDNEKSTKLQDESVEKNKEEKNESEQKQTEDEAEKINSTPGNIEEKSCKKNGTEDVINVPLAKFEDDETIPENNISKSSPRPTRPDQENIESIEIVDDPHFENNESRKINSSPLKRNEEIIINDSDGQEEGNMPAKINSSSPLKAGTQNEKCVQVDDSDSEKETCEELKKSLKVADSKEKLNISLAKMSSVETEETISPTKNKENRISSDDIEAFNSSSSAMKSDESEKTSEEVMIDCSFNNLNESSSKGDHADKPKVIEDSQEESYVETDKIKTSTENVSKSSPSKAKSTDESSKESNRKKSSDAKESGEKLNVSNKTKKQPSENEELSSSKGNKSDDSNSSNVDESDKEPDTDIKKQKFSVGNETNDESDSSEDSKNIKKMKSSKVSKFDEQSRKKAEKNKSPEVNESDDESNSSEENKGKKYESSNREESEDESSVLKPKTKKSLRIEKSSAAKRNKKTKQSNSLENESDDESHKKRNQHSDKSNNSSEMDESDDESNSKERKRIVKKSSNKKSIIEIRQSILRIKDSSKNKESGRDSISRKDLKKSEGDANENAYKSKPRRKTSLNAASDEMDSVLDTLVHKKLSEYNSSDDEDESDEDYDVNEFIDDEAFEGEEDTPSEGSNDIVEIGESIHSSDTEDESYDEDYENDSFIDDDEGVVELLPGDEYDIGLEKTKKKKSRIIRCSDSEEDDVFEELQNKSKELDENNIESEDEIVKDKKKETNKERLSNADKRKSLKKCDDEIIEDEPSNTRRTLKKSDEFIEENLIKSDEKTDHRRKSKKSDDEIIEDKPRYKRIKSKKPDENIEEKVMNKSDENADHMEKSKKSDDEIIEDKPRYKRIKSNKPDEIIEEKVVNKSDEDADHMEKPKKSNDEIVVLSKSLIVEIDEDQNQPTEETDDQHISLAESEHNVPEDEEHKSFKEDANESFNEDISNEKIMTSLSNKQQTSNEDVVICVSDSEDNSAQSAIVEKKKIKVIQDIMISPQDGVMINKLDNLESLERIKSDDLEMKEESYVVTGNASSNTPNNSILNVSSSSRRKSLRKTSISFQENIKVSDTANSEINDKITQVVDFLCSSITQKKGNLCLNVSLDFSSNSCSSDDYPIEKPIEKSPESPQKKVLGGMKLKTIDVDISDDTREESNMKSLHEKLKKTIDTQEISKEETRNKPQKKLKEKDETKTKPIKKLTKKKNINISHEETSDEDVEFVKRPAIKKSKKKFNIPNSGNEDTTIKIKKKVCDEEIIDIVKTKRNKKTYNIPQPEDEQIVKKSKKKSKSDKITAEESTPELETGKKPSSLQEDFVSEEDGQFSKNVSEEKEILKKSKKKSKRVKITAEENIPVLEMSKKRRSFQEDFVIEEDDRSSKKVSEEEEILKKSKKKSKTRKITTEETVPALETGKKRRSLQENFAIEEDYQISKKVKTGKCKTVYLEEHLGPTIKQKRKLPEFPVPATIGEPKSKKMKSKLEYLPSEIIEEVLERPTASCSEIAGKKASKKMKKNVVKVKPSSSAFATSSSWDIEDVKPPKKTAKKIEDLRSKLQANDFKNRMIYDTSRNKRVDVKALKSKVNKKFDSY